MTTREKLLSAIELAFNEIERDPTKDAGWPKRYEIILDDILDAMREPSEEMVSARDHYDDLDDDNKRYVWRSMIDAIRDGK